MLDPEPGAVLGEVGLHAFHGGQGLVAVEIEGGDHLAGAVLAGVEEVTREKNKRIALLERLLQSTMNCLSAGWPEENPALATELRDDGFIVV